MFNVNSEGNPCLTFPREHCRRLVYGSVLDDGAAYDFCICFAFTAAGSIS
jgi:hypothetical protein